MSTQSFNNLVQEDWIIQVPDATYWEQEVTGDAGSEQGSQDSIDGMSGNVMANPRIKGMLHTFGSRSLTSALIFIRIHSLMMMWYFRNRVSSGLKRVLDLTLSLIILPLVSPIMLLTALAIRLESPGPVLFRQERIGKWGKPFTCFKFRSMYVDAEQRKAELKDMNEADEIVFKIKHDPRVTKVGRVIRKLSLDEFPQLFNVIKGDMSLVGPRPLVTEEVRRYKFEHYRRLDVLPGMTGLQQISGRSELEFKRWVELDVRYIRESSVWTDLMIIIKTIPAIIRGRGAY